MSNIAVPDQVTSASGQVISLGGGNASSGSPREAYRAVVDTFPGQSSACPVCGAMASEAPEGIHDHTAANPNAPGDPKWQAESCFKCGYRPGNTAVQREAELYTQFKAWLAAATAEDMAHKSLNPPSAADELTSLHAMAERLGVTINPTSSEA